MPYPYSVLTRVLLTDDDERRGGGESKKGACNEGIPANSYGFSVSCTEFS